MDRWRASLRPGPGLSAGLLAACLAVLGWLPALAQEVLPPVISPDQPPDPSGPVAVAARLRARGFSEAEIAQAFADFQAYGTGQPEQVERLAAFRLLNLPEAERRDFLAWDMTVTRYYNWRIGGLGQRITGWVLTGGGLSTLGVAGLMYLIDQGCQEGTTSNDEHGTVKTSVSKGCEAVFGTLALAYGLTGAVLTGVGVSLVSSGTARTDQWAPEELLDIGSRTELVRYRLGPDGSLPAPMGRADAAAPGPSAPRLTLLPWLSPRAQGGLGLVLTF